MEPTAREKMLYQMTAADYVAAFKAGEVTAKEYAEALVNRMMHYEMLNAWFVTSYETSYYIIEDAEAIEFLHMLALRGPHLREGVEGAMTSFLQHNPAFCSHFIKCSIVEHAQDRMAVHLKYEYKHTHKYKYK